MNIFAYMLCFGTILGFVLLLIAIYKVNPPRYRRTPEEQEREDACWVEGEYGLYPEEEELL